MAFCSDADRSCDAVLLCEKARTIVSKLSFDRNVASNDPPVLCWFCGEYKFPVLHGKSIGEMVYSSEIHMSQELDGTDCAPQEHHFAAVFQSCSIICFDCIRRFLAKSPVLDAAYVERHRENYSEQLAEVASTDTGLLSWREKHFPYGCWLSGYPDIGVDKKLWSLTMSELYSRGFRLSGRIVLGEWEFNRFLDRFSVDKDVPLPSGFVDHFTKHIHLIDSAYYQRMATIRAVVFDVSIVIASGEFGIS